MNRSFAILGLLLLSCLVFCFKQFIFPSPIPEIQVFLPKEKTQLKFLMLGDTGSGDLHQKAVAQAMDRICEVQKPLDGIILLGDLFYPSGIQHVNDSQWETKIWEPYGLPCLKDLPIYPILGNHDYKGDTQAILDKAQGSSRWVMPDRFYSVRFGNLLHMIAFDSVRPNLPNLFSQISQRNQSRWQIVLSHHPLASSSGKGWNYRYNLLGFFVGPFVAVDAWFAGHSHHLEHRKEIFFRDKPLSAFILGGGGGPLYPLAHSQDSQTLFAHSVFGFSFLDISQEFFTVSLYNSQNELMYQTHLESSKDN